MKIGKPKYEQSSKNYFSFKKDQNSFILRILPPIGELADKGKWYTYCKVEYGYTDSAGKLKPFLSPRKVDFKTKMVEVESEAHLRREKIKVKLAKAEEDGDAATVETCRKMLSKYNLDSKYYMNAIDLQGNVGLFKIGYRGFKALEAKIDSLRSGGVDPIGIENGRFFVFSRSGKGRDTIYTVDEYKEKVSVEINGEITAVDKTKSHAITDDVIAKLESDAFELNKLYTEVTPEQEHKIVHGGPTGVDEVFDEIIAAKKATKEVDKSEAPATETVKMTSGEATSPVETQVQTEKLPEPQSESMVVDTGETVDMSTGEITEEVKEVTPAAESKGLDEMSDDEFLASLG